ncbi:MFS transporter [Sphingomonas lacunae]|uniref:MFS transporter n=1 Tax=Sphingomonas lacunae TaxID=2698828 RepID=A0A6M4ASN9_9SPHN|nr:MFS transporter [Sphingomonas lacunae]QJQ31440.1 MFS transporter [Sphingomonas lacunae]
MTATATTPDTSTTLPRGLWPFIIALWIAEITGSFESAMIIAAMKHLIRDFGDPALVGWLVTAYLIIGAAVAAIVGRLGDIFGRRRLMIIVLVATGIGSLISAFSTDFTWLLIGRIIQGLSGAILPLCVGLTREHVPPAKVPMVIGLMISGASVGTATGLVLGGLIVDHYSWHGVFIASAIFCAITIVACLAFVPRSTPLPDSRRVDWINGIAFAPGIMALLYYVSTAPKTGWTTPHNLAAAGIGITFLAWWLHRSLNSSNPLLDVRLLAKREVAVTNLASAIIAMSALQLVLLFSLMLQAPTWTLVGLGATATVAGLAKIPSNILATGAGPFSGWLMTRYGGRFSMVSGGIICTVGWTLAWFDHGSITAVVIALCVISFGATILFAVAPTIVTAAAPVERSSEVSGMLGVVRGLSLGIGAQFVTTLLATDQVTRGSESYPSPAAFQLAIGAIIACCIVATLIALALPGKDKAASHG